MASMYQAMSHFAAGASGFCPAAAFTWHRARHMAINVSRRMAVPSQASPVPSRNEGTYIGSAASSTRGITTQAVFSSVSRKHQAKPAFTRRSVRNPPRSQQYPGKRQHIIQKTAAEGDRSQQQSQHYLYHGPTPGCHRRAMSSGGASSMADSMSSLSFLSSFSPMLLTSCAAFTHILHRRRLKPTAFAGKCDSFVIAYKLPEGILYILALLPRRHRWTILVSGPRGQYNV